MFTLKTNLNLQNLENLDKNPDKIYLCSQKRTDKLEEPQPQMILNVLRIEDLQSKRILSLSLEVNLTLRIFQSKEKKKNLTDIKVPKL